MAESQQLKPVEDRSALSRLHYELVRGLVQNGSCPTKYELAGKLSVTPAELDDIFRSLADIHGVVLHPHTPAPWVIHPFSLTPTLNWIEGRGRSWWAPCIWCGFGVAALVGGDVHLHSRYGAEGDAIILPVRDGVPRGLESVVVHFAIPPARAWDNVHEHCSMVLPFRSAADITQWCARHALPKGEAVPLHQVADLARLWYGSHARPDWHKWSVAEAEDIFHHVGLTSSFWDLEKKAGQF